ncbi:MAG: T9SS C-terminal target domain-containing protein [Ignavibacteriae bacterium]|nr:MAG: T9SS C-terminal target domain-containing protein [Ignavibacteriota bacterium]
MKKNTFLLILIILQATIYSQPYFQSISGGAITITTNASNRCAWGDYDNDGLIDIVVSTYNDSCMTCTYPLLLLKNYGNENFQRVNTAPIGTVTSRTFGVAWGDYDNDAKLDLFVCSGFNLNNLLFHNDGNGVFTQITTGSIVNDGGWSEACAWGDYDRDGWLDLFVANQSNQNNFLYHNNANGTFTKITTGNIVNDGGTSKGCAWSDYDNDGWPDLFVVNYSAQNDFLYHNNGNGTFTKITSGPIVNDGMYGSGCTWGDYDNDGYLDLYVTNNNQPNCLYHNNGNGTFSLFSGGPSSESGYSFGCSWGDYNNDGYLDLFMAKQNPQNALYKNVNGTSFVKVTNEPDMQTGTYSVGNAWGDFNNDGKLDLFVTNNRSSSVNKLYKNIGPSSNYLILKLKGCNTIWGRSNYNAIGARIVIRDGNTKIIREISGGSGMGSQDMFWQHIGLGSITNADSINVYWPSGNKQKLTNIASNQTIFIDECFVNVENPTATTPSKYELLQNYPNPFNPITSIEYSILKAGNAKILIFDITGKLISTLIDEKHNPGNYKVDFDGSNISSGIYIYKLETEEFTAVKKMILMK